MARPVWFDKGNDVQAVAKHLDDLAATATALRFTPVPLPADADLAVLHQAALTRARRQLAASNTETDRILAQEVRAVDDLVRTANLLVERLREWYALHAPEATRHVTDAERLARLVAEQGDRTAVMAALDMAAQAPSSLGTDLPEGDLAVLKGFAGALAAVHASWHALEERIKVLMSEVAPNLDSVVGPVVGARLIALSGGLSRLATWPSGTVQLLGAETALFRHIKEGTRPPKHGILFQHPLVHQAPAWQRGPIARSLALCASLAAKADAFTKNDLKAKLAADLAEALERIRRERPKPQARRERPMTTRAGRPVTPGRPSPRVGPPRDDRGPPRGPSRAPPARGHWEDRRTESSPRAGWDRGERAGPPREGGGWRAGPAGSRGPPAPSQARAPGAGAPGGGFGARDGGRYAGGAAGGPNGDPSGGDRPQGGKGGWGLGPRDGPGAGPAGGGFGARGPGPRDGPRDGSRGTGGSDGWKPRRKPQGAFRNPNSPAKPPGKGDKP